MFSHAEIHRFKAPESESRTESGPTHLGAPDRGVLFGRLLASVVVTCRSSEGWDRSPRDVASVADPVWQAAAAPAAPTGRAPHDGAAETPVHIGSRGKVQQCPLAARPHGTRVPLRPPGSLWWTSLQQLPRSNSIQSFLFAAGEGSLPQGCPSGRNEGHRLLRYSFPVAIN